MDFSFSDEQEQLRTGVHAFLAKEAPLTFARAMMDDPAGFTPASWRSLAALGWLGLCVPEDYGGSGLALLDLCIVMEEMGAVVFPGPYMSTVCLGIPALVAAAGEEQKARLLPAIVDGSSRVTLAIAEERGSWIANDLVARATPADGGWTLEGTKLFVPDARSSEVILVACRLDDGFGFVEVSAEDAGVTVEPMSGIDETRKLDVVELADVRVDRSRVLGGRSVDAQAVDGVVDRAKVALAAEMCGAAAAVVDMSVEYAKVRTQFGRAIGSFQAIQHKLADMKVSLENSRSLVYYAAWALDTGAADARLAAAMAKAYASDACMQVVAEGIQVHGGIGFTWEHDMHLYFKRVKSSELTYGDATENRELVAHLLPL